MNQRSEWAVEVAGLVKAFGGTRAVDGLDLRVPRGAVQGLLGPNGAGKTTTIRILSTLVRPDAGAVAVLGYDVVRQPEAVRQRISLTGQFAAVDDDLTALENLVLFARLRGFSRVQAKERAHELLEAFGLDAAGRRRANTFSGGMRRRLDIAASIVVTPELLFLDEPTAGLDPQSRNDVWDIVREVVAEGATVFLTTQYLEEADQLADQIAVVDQGRVVASGTPGSLKASLGAGMLRLRLVDPRARAAAAAIVSRALGAAATLDSELSALTVPASDAGRTASALLELERAGIAVSTFALGQPSLDEVFLALTGRKVAELPEEEAA
jgi:ABC-2 type transport system ATP-binding protein